VRGMAVHDPPYGNTYITGYVHLRGVGVQNLPTKKMLLHIKSDWKGVAKEDRKTYWERARIDVHEALEFLALYAEKMPEDQLKQVITKESLKPFLEALLRPGTGPWISNAAGSRHPKSSPDWDERRQRLVGICRLLIDELWTVSSALAPKATWYTTHEGEHHRMNGLRALLIGD